MIACTDISEHLPELRRVAASGREAMRARAEALGYEHPQDVADVAAVLLGDGCRRQLHERGIPCSADSSSSSRS